MISMTRLASIESRLEGIEPARWEVVEKALGDHPAIRIAAVDQRTVLLRVTRENEPAGLDEVEFIAHAPEDLRRLVDHVKGVRRCTPAEFVAITTRVSRAARPPWKPFLRSKGGVGGDSVIWVSGQDGEPDLYLWIDSDPAPDTYFDFVAAARQDVPDLLQEAQSQGD